VLQIKVRPLQHCTCFLNFCGGQASCTQ
jgi:hypothetical protein